MCSFLDQRIEFVLPKPTKHHQERVDVRLGGAARAAGASPGGGASTDRGAVGKDMARNLKLCFVEVSFQGNDVVESVVFF